MAAVPELLYELQHFEARWRAEYHASNEWCANQYLSPNFLSYFPVVIESAAKQENLSWNEVSGLFWHRDAIPATLIDEDLLMQLTTLGVFKKPESCEYAKQHSLVLFRLLTAEGDRYAITVVYLPSCQKRLDMSTALSAMYSTLVGMPKNYTDCAYMPEPTNGKHYTLLPVSGDAMAAFGPVGDFAAAALTKGSTHVRVGSRIVVKLPGSFTQDPTDNVLMDEEVYRRGPIWDNKDLIEMESDDITPVIRNGRTVTMEREVAVSAADVYTKTTAGKPPLTIVACKPGYMPDYGEFTESMSEMQVCLEREMDAEQRAQREERIQQRMTEQGMAITMDTTPAATDPAAIPGTDLHVVTPEGVTMEDFSESGKVTVDLTDKKASTGNTRGPATQPQGAAGGGRAGTAISDAELAAELTMFQCLDTMSKDLNILEEGYFKCVDETRKVMREVSAEMDALDDAYVAGVMGALAQWQEHSAGALQAMHTADIKEWDERHTQLVKVTVVFHNECMEADTTQTQGLADLNKQIASGTCKDSAVAVLELASECIRKITDDTAQEYLDALKESLMGRISLDHLPTLVASTHGMMMTFRTAVWRLISDESVWPSRLRSAGFCKMAPIVRQSLTTIPALCGLVVPP